MKSQIWNFFEFFVIFEGEKNIQLNFFHFSPTGKARMSAVQANLQIHHSQCYLNGPVRQVQSGSTNTCGRLANVPIGYESVICIIAHSLSVSVSLIF